jgi:hypothetical protein
VVLPSSTASASKLLRVVDRLRSYFPGVSKGRMEALVDRKRGWTRIIQRIA